MLSIASGLTEHNGYAVVLIETVAELQRRTIASPSVEVGAFCHSLSEARARSTGATHGRFLTTPCRSWIREACLGHLTICTAP